MGKRCSAAQFNALLQMIATTRLRKLILLDYKFSDGQMAAFAKALNANPAVSDLRLTFDEEPDTMLIHHLASFTHLRTTCTVTLGAGHSRRAMAACRANASLHRIESTTLVRFPDDQWRLMSAYLERNQNLPTLLAHPQLHGATESKQTDLVLFPSLFQVACDARRMAPTFLLTGLLAAEEAVGVGGAGSNSIFDKKRSPTK